MSASVFPLGDKVKGESQNFNESFFFFPNESYFLFFPVN